MFNLPKNENGKIYGINTSSAWALMSCGWYEYEDETGAGMMNKGRLVTKRTKKKQPTKRKTLLKKRS